jgi:hypothetical protein
MAEVPSLEARTVVLVHGGFVDGSGWEGVYIQGSTAGCAGAAHPATAGRLSIPGQGEVSRFIRG